MQFEIIQSVPADAARREFESRKQDEWDAAQDAKAEQAKREADLEANVKKLATTGQKVEAFDAVATIRANLAKIGGNYSQCMAMVEAGKQKVDEARDGWLANGAAPENFQLLAAAGAEHTALLAAQADIANLSRAYRDRITRSDETTTALYDAIKALQTKVRTRICALNDEWTKSNAKIGFDGGGSEHPGVKEMAVKLSQLAEAILWIQDWQGGNKRDTTPWEKYSNLV